MFAISVKKYFENKVHTITIGNRRLFWVRMHIVQEVLGIKNISDLVRKEIHGIFENNNSTKHQTRKFPDDIYT